MQSRIEQNEAKIRAGKEIVQSKEMIDYWNIALKDVSNSKTSREGRKKFKQYKKNARVYYWV